MDNPIPGWLPLKRENNRWLWQDADAHIWYSNKVREAHKNLNYYFINGKPEIVFTYFQNRFPVTSRVIAGVIPEETVAQIVDELAPASSTPVIDALRSVVMHGTELFTITSTCRNAPVNHVNLTGDTPMSWLMHHRPVSKKQRARRGYERRFHLILPEMMELLLASGADVNHINPLFEEQSVLLMAFRYLPLNTSVIACRILLEHGADVNFASPEIFHSTLCHLAVQKDNLAVFRAALAHGADAEASDDGNSTALAWLCYKECTLSRKIMLKGLLRTHDIGRIFNRQNFRRETPLMEALRRDSNKMPNIYAAERLLEKGYHSGINTPNHTGHTPLMLACREGWWSGAVQMIRQGANLSICDNEGNNCLHATCSSVFSGGGSSNPSRECWIDEMTSSLPRAYFNARNSSGSTPLRRAVRCHWTVVEALLRGGATCTFSDIHNHCTEYFRPRERKNRTTASDNNNRRIIRVLLLNSDVDVNDRQDRDRVSLLHIASRHDVRLTSFLLSQGARMYSRPFLTSERERSFLKQTLRRVRLERGLYLSHIDNFYLYALCLSRRVHRDMRDIMRVIFEYLVPSKFRVYLDASQNMDRLCSGCGM